jgi:hypothetical protein
MTIEERIKRNGPEDQVYLGEIVERMVAGESGTLLKMIINGMIAEWLMDSETRDSMDANRYLGRIEALNKLQDRLDFMVDVKEKFTEEIRENAAINNESGERPHA